MNNSTKQQDLNQYDLVSLLAQSTCHHASENLLKLNSVNYYHLMFRLGSGIKYYINLTKTLFLPFCNLVKMPDRMVSAHQMQSYPGSRHFLAIFSLHEHNLSMLQNIMPVKKAVVMIESLMTKVKKTHYKVLF